jgi:uncharacterized protein YecE (DUF72 family)
MLEHYSARLRGIELNGSFYRMPLAGMLEKWAGTTPPLFRFCMKAHRGLTYSADGFDRVGLARLFGERMAALGPRRGPVLLQFPPARQRDLALLDSLLDAIGGPVASEFRHESWLHDDTYEVIRRHGGALVVTDEEKWPMAPLMRLGTFAYFRLRRDYRPRGLAHWVETVGAALEAHAEVHVYFKHDPGAPGLALRLQRGVAGAGSAPRPRR